MNIPHLFIHSLVEGHLDCFHLMPPVNSAFIKFMQIFLLEYLFFFFFPFEYIPRSGIFGLCGNSMFKLLRNHQTLFHSGYTILQPHQQCIRVLLLLLILFYFVLHIWWYLMFKDILTKKKKNLLSLDPHKLFSFQ